MRGLAALFTVITTMQADLNASTINSEFECTGSGRSYNYPTADRIINVEKYKILIIGGNISMIRHGTPDFNFCISGSTCISTITSSYFTLTISKIPHSDPGYTGRIQIDRKTLAFEAGGGGLDGGWGTTGVCIPAAH